MQPYARNLGVILDSQLNMEKHISNICRTAYAYIRNISRIRRFLSRSDTEKLMHAFITSRLDSCNSLLVGLPASTLKPLARVQNCAARVVFRARKSEHITPILKELHWLPVDYRIQFKVLLLTFKSLYGSAPKYLCDLISWYEPKRNLRSASLFQLAETYVRGSKASFRGRAFQHCAPALWNRLPLHVRSCKTIVSFKSSLKTFLFNEAFYKVSFYFLFSFCFLCFHFLFCSLIYCFIFLLF